MHYRVLAIGIAASMFSGTAAAQAPPKVIVNPATLERRQPLRPQGQNPRWINRADCLADDVFTFQTTVNRVNTLLLEVWAGSETTDCLPKHARDVAANVCWLVYQDTPSKMTWPVRIRAQDIVGRSYPARSGGPGVFPNSAAVCGSGMHGAVTLHFMFVEDTKISGEASTWTQTGVDLNPPTSASEVSVEPGEDRLLVNWAAPDGGLREWRLYCDAVPAGSGAGKCPAATSALVPGQLAPEARRCGTAADPGERSGYADGLTNDVEYAVGVAGVDGTGNVGPLSALACGAPELHAEDGGPIAARSCAIEHRASGAFDGVWVACCGLLARLRRRRR